jgi:hypothetical protein
VVEDPKTGPYVKGAIDKVGPGLASRSHRAHPARTARLHARPSRLQLAAVRSVTRDSEFSDRNLAQRAFASVQVVRDADEALAVLADGESQRHFAATNMCAGTGTLPTSRPMLCTAQGTAKEHSTPIPSRSWRGAAPRCDGRLGCAWCMLAWHRMLRTGVTSGAALALQWLYFGCTVVALWLYCGCTVLVLGPCGAGTIIRRALMSSSCWCWRRAKKSSSPRWT